MSHPGIVAAPTIYPAMRYRDADAAIEFLKRAYGFTEYAVHRDGDGAIAHAELELGGGMIMLGSMRDDDLNLIPPRDAGCVTASVYVYVENIDAHYATATAAGAEIVRPLDDTPYGSREYTSRDREGQLWSFGTYRPAAGPIT